MLTKSNQNWGATPFYTGGLNQWYWGHGRLGECSLVWFYVVSQDLSVVASAYVAKDGQIQYVGEGAIQVRPTGPGVPYPIPLGFNGTIEGLTIDIDAGDYGIFNITAQQTNVVAVTQIYKRWVGTLSGHKAGGPTQHGIAVWEQMGPVPAFG